MQPATFQAICQHVVADWPPDQWRNVGIAIAVSGGPDSVLLARVMHFLWDLESTDDAHRPLILHVNHQLRSTSQADQTFVVQLAQQLQLPLATHRLDSSLAEKGRPTSEEALRRQRYQWLLSEARRNHCRYLLTGHTRDDQAETILFRILRGTGLAGLTGIPRVRVADSISILRPLLGISRKQIAAALNELEQEFCTDESNLTNQYTRNFLRNEVLPAFSERFPAWEASLIRLGEQADRLAEYLDIQAEDWLQGAVSEQRRGIALSRSEILAADPVVTTHALVRLWKRMGWPRNDMNQDWWIRLVRLAEDSVEADVLNLPGGIRVQRSKDFLVITPEQ